MLCILHQSNKRRISVELGHGVCFSPTSITLPASKEMQFISTMRIGQVHVENIEDLLQLIHTFSEDGFLQILEEKMPRVALFLQERLVIVRVFIAKARLLQLALYVTLHARRSLDLGARKWETIGTRETKAKKWLESVARLTNTKQKDISKIVDDMEGKAMCYGPKVMLVGEKQTPCPSSTDIRRLFDWCNVHNMFHRNLKNELLFP